MAKAVWLNLRKRSPECSTLLRLKMRLLVLTGFRQLLLKVPCLSKNATSPAVLCSVFPLFLSETLRKRVAVGIAYPAAITGYLCTAKIWGIGQVQFAIRFFAHSQLQKSELRQVLAVLSGAVGGGNESG
ncbi:hypothetical protein [Nostoc sp. FACHB-888]|uniref:hypothetical protein n=1 Tax=Nostoc sp. FACHB-888 TaxID=2692842 RepID=UPI0016895613|nr:hypothetical protein [Nostoc sp. FACHB-888]MBD2248052.1 hypothetical protein [Nostoc sp. FACHB-888]